MSEREVVFLSGETVEDVYGQVAAFIAGDRAGRMGMSPDHYDGPHHDYFERGFAAGQSIARREAHANAQKGRLL